MRDAAGGIDLQKINVKLGEDAPGLDWDKLLAVFSRWREEEGEEMLDLADYAHVPEGPSVVLVSKRWHFGIDFARGSGAGRTGGWGGLFLSTRKNLEGDLEARVRAATKLTLEKIQRLLGEAEFAGDSTFAVKLGELDIVFNDRVQLPNTDESDTLARPAVDALANALYGDGLAKIEKDEDASRRLGYSLSADTDLDLAGALSRLA